MTKPFYFEDHTVGDTVECGEMLITAEDIIAFAKQWDPQPWHVDIAAAKESMFGGLTACSAHIFSIYCITSQRWQNGYTQQALAGLGFDELKMLTPVFADDTLQCLTTINLARKSKSKPGCGIIVYLTELVNQNDVTVFSVKCSTLMLCRPEASN